MHTYDLCQYNSCAVKGHTRVHGGEAWEQGYTLSVWNKQHMSMKYGMLSVWYRGQCAEMNMWRSVDDDCVHYN